MKIIQIHAKVRFSRNCVKGKRIGDFTELLREFGCLKQMAVQTLSEEISEITLKNSFRLPKNQKQEI